MNKNTIIILSIIGLVVLGGVGYAIWSNSNSAQVAVQTPTTTTNTTTTTTVQTSAPLVETNSSATAYVSTVLVAGNVNPNGLATTYWFDYGQTSSLGTKTSGYLAGSGFTKIYAPAYITGLQENTTYYFRLSANNSLGTTSGTINSFKTNSTPAPQGTAPTTTTQNATDVARNTVNLHGKINPNGSQTTFWFEYGLNANLGVVTSFQSMNSSNSASNVAVSLSNLTPLTKYYFRLNAQNQFGTINGEILNFTTLGPAEATTPKINTNPANAITSSVAKLNATISANGAQTTYWFEYSTVSLLSSNVVVSSTPQESLNATALNSNVSATINNLKSNTKYYFQVIAKNQYGTSRGDMVTFTTKR